LTVLLIGQERCAIRDIQIELARGHDAVAVSRVDDGVIAFICDPRSCFRTERSLA
jgi:hypothetical protein